MFALFHELCTSLPDSKIITSYKIMNMPHIGKCFSFPLLSFLLLLLLLFLLLLVLFLSFYLYLPSNNKNKHTIDIEEDGLASLFCHFLSSAFPFPLLRLNLVSLPFLALSLFNFFASRLLCTKSPLFYSPSFLVVRSVGYANINAWKQNFTFSSLFSSFVCQKIK